MGVRLILTLALDGDTDEQVREYGGRVVESILDARRRGADALIEWHAHQLVAVTIEADPPSVHSPLAAVEAPHAMVNDDGDLFYPDGPDDAAEFAEHHGARFVDPGFAWS
jgi:hypothetical protein